MNFPFNCALNLEWVLKPTWGRLAMSWDVLGASWASLGASGGCLEKVLGSLGISSGRLGTSLEQLGSIGRLQGVFRRLVLALGRLETCWAFPRASQGRLVFQSQAKRPNTSPNGFLRCCFVEQIKTNC